MAQIELPIGIEHLEAVIRDRFRLEEIPEIIEVEYDELAEQIILKVFIEDYEFVEGFFTNLEQSIDTSLIEEMI